MFFASSSLETSAEVLLDRYSPTPYHYAMPKVIYPRSRVPRHLSPVKRPRLVTCPLG